MMLGQGHEGGSGSLTDATALAAADSTTRFKMPPPDVGYTTPPPPPPVEVEVAVEETAAPAIEAGGAPPPFEPRPPKRRFPLMASLVVGGGALGGTDYDGFSTLGLAVSGYPQSRVRLDATGTVNGVNFTGEGLLGHAFKGAAELNLDVTARYYLTKDHTLFGVYPLAGLGTGTLFWDYAHPVTITEDGRPKTLRDDRINYFSCFGGAGMSLLQTRYVHVGGNVVGGVRFYGWHTDSGLENNLLETTGFMKALLEISFRVGSTE